TGAVAAGRFNPTGPVVLAGPYQTRQAPIFYGALQTGRPPDPKDHFTSKYLDMPVEPQFPFGHGLSYSRFTLKNLRVDVERFRPGDDIAVAVDVATEGPSAGDATIFLFIRDVVASVARPL